MMNISWRRDALVAYVLQKRDGASLLQNAACTPESLSMYRAGALVEAGRWAAAHWENGPPTSGGPTFD
jgi:hypothetical protein